MPTDNEFSTLEAVASVLESLSHFTDALKNVSPSLQSVPFSVTSWITVFVPLPMTVP